MRSCPQLQEAMRGTIALILRVLAALVECARFGHLGPMSERIVHLRIAGRVQGVGYRYFVEDQARARGLRGWVRNRRDGAVEAVVAGQAESVEELIAACWRGPSAARVADVQVTPLAPAEADLPAAGFSIRATA
jgi:acylphosphatase